MKTTSLLQIQLTSTAILQGHWHVRPHPIVGCPLNSKCQFIIIAQRDHCYFICSVPERKKVLTDHRSYHGTLTQKEAESELKQYSQHNTTCYLTRWSKDSKSFKVSVCVEGQCYHLRLSITKEDGGSMCELEGASTQFNDVFKLLEFM